MDFLQAPHDMELGPGEIHLWRHFIDLTRPPESAMVDVLSPDERLRAERYLSPAKRADFIQQRALLRNILARYLTFSPADIVFQYSAQGRPSLDPGTHKQQVNFNLSHSGQTVLYTVAYDRTVGVDVELMRQDINIRAIGKRYFTASEVEFLAATASSEQRKIFFKIWVSKEAYLKARGEGLHVPLNSFETIPTDNKSIIISSLRNDKTDPDWKIELFEPYPDYMGAIAAPGRDWSWRGYDVTPTILKK